MKNCRGCNDPLTPANDSEAHIIPRALGGRLAPKGLVCRKCNGDLDRLADNALVQAFGAWPTLLAIPRQGGQNPAKIISTRDGHKVRVEPDGSLTRTDVLYRVSAMPGGHKVELAAGDRRTVRQLLNRTKKQFPQFDPALAEQYATVVGMSPDTELELRLDFSPKATFGGVTTAIWLFLIHETGRAFMEWERLLACIAQMQTTGGIFRYLINGLPGLQGPQIDLGHKLIIKSVPATGELIAYVEILGVLKIGGVFAKSTVPAIPLEQIYVYDLTAKCDRTKEFSIDPEQFDVQDWRAIGLGPGDATALREHFKNASEVFAAHYRMRFSSNAVGGEV